MRLNLGGDRVCKDQFAQRFPFHLIKVNFCVLRHKILPDICFATHQDLNTQTYVSQAAAASNHRRRHMCCCVIDAHNRLCVP